MALISLISQYFESFACRADCESAAVSHVGRDRTICASAASHISPNERKCQMNRRYLLPLLAVVGAARSLKAQTTVGPVMSMMIRPQMEIFRNATQTYTLSQTLAPGTKEMVFVNGLLMCAGDDYTLTGNTLTFTRQTIGGDPVIQIQYWSLA